MKTMNPYTEWEKIYISSIKNEEGKDIELFWILQLLKG